MADIIDIFQWLEDDATYNQCAAFFKTTDKLALMVSIYELGVMSRRELIAFLSMPSLDMPTVIDTITDKLHSVVDNISIQDICDIYVLTLMNDLSSKDIGSAYIAKYHKPISELPSIMTPKSLPGLSDAYEKYAGAMIKPRFQTLISRYNAFSEPLLNDLFNAKHIWECGRGIWVEY